MAKLSSLDFLALCVVDYLEGEEKKNRKKFLSIANAKLHKDYKEIELLEVEKFETALFHIKMLILPR